MKQAMSIFVLLCLLQKAWKMCRDWAMYSDGVEAVLSSGGTTAYCAPFPMMSRGVSMATLVLAVCSIAPSSSSSSSSDDLCGQAGNQLLFQSHPLSDGTIVEVREDRSAHFQMSKFIMPLFDDQGNILAQNLTVNEADNGPLGGEYRYLIFRPKGIRTCEVQTAAKCDSAGHASAVLTVAVEPGELNVCTPCRAIATQQKGYFRTIVSAVV